MAVASAAEQVVVVVTSSADMEKAQAQAQAAAAEEEAAESRAVAAAAAEGGSGHSSSSGEEKDRDGRRHGLELFGRGMGYWVLMAASSAALVLGLSSATLLGRLYFVHGGSRRWLYTWIECTGWPILLIPLAISYYCRQRRQQRRGTKEADAEAEAEAGEADEEGGGECGGGSGGKSFSFSSRVLTPRLVLCFLALGSLTALDNLLYSWGLSYLPVSTNSLLCSSQLAFNAVFSYLLVGQRLSWQALNAVVVVTLGTALLALTSASERPEGTSQAQYAVGVVVTVLASALFALILPLTELVYRRVLSVGSRSSSSSSSSSRSKMRARSSGSFVVVMEVQIGVSMVASLCSLLGMWAGGDFGALREEAAAFDLGVAAYVATLAWSAVGWQLYVLGGVGIVFLASPLMSCVFMTAMIPVLPLLALAFFNDSFSPVKAIAMLLSLWGFLSYLYGAYLHTKKIKKISSLPQ